MKQIMLSIVICSFALASAFGTVQSDLQDAGRLHKEFNYTDEKTLLLGSLGQAVTPKEKYDDEQDRKRQSQGREGPRQDLAIIGLPGTEGEE